RFAVAAGDLAAERLGFVEAASRYETALRLWDDDGARERPAVLMRLGRAALLAGRPTGARTALIEAAAAALLDPLGPSPELVQALVWASTFSMLEGHREDGAAMARRGLEMAERL